MKAYLLAILIGTTPQLKVEFGYTFNTYEHCMETGRLLRIQVRDVHGRLKRYVIECKQG